MDKIDSSVVSQCVEERSVCSPLICPRSASANVPDWASDGAEWAQRGPRRSPSRDPGLVDNEREKPGFRSPRAGQLPDLGGRVLCCDGKTRFPTEFATARTGTLGL